MSTALYDMVPLWTVSTINDEVLPEKTDPGFEFDYVDISNVSTGKISTSLERFTFGKAPSRARRIARKDDVIVSTVRTYLRAIAPVDKSNEHAIFSTGFAVVRPQADRVHPAYLKYAFLSTPLIETIITHSNGVSYPATNASDIARTPVPLPPLDTQRAIADYLDRETSEIDAMLDKLDGLGRLLEERLHNDIETAYLSTGNVTNAPIGAVTMGHIGGTGLVGSQTPISSGESGVLKTSAISAGVYKPQENRSLPTNCTPEPFARVRKGMVLVNRLNSPEYVGASVLVDQDDHDLYFTDKIWNVLIEKTRLSPAYFCYWTRTSQYRQNILGRVVGTSASMLSLSYRDFERFRIPLPPLDEQERIVQHLDETTARIDAMLAKTQQLKDLLTERRSALITAAVTGQIEVH